MTFTCSATGPPEPVVTWSKSQGNLPALRNVVSGGKLTIINVTRQDSGSYVCNATNAISENSSSVELKVLCSLVAINKPTSSVVLYVGQALQLSCPASTGAVVVWMHNGTTSLPQEALIETPDTLFIPSLSKDHAGIFSCVSGNSVFLNVNLSVKHPKTCTTVKQSICDISRHYVIDPDGGQGMAPFTVYCNMTDRGGIGVTAVSHNSKNRTHVTGFEPRGSYSRDIQYGASASQIQKLIAVSSNCEQFIKFECKGVVLFFNGVAYGWWVSHDGKVMTYWSEASEATKGCACRATSSCTNPQHFCNCDINDYVWREDSGLLTNKSHLPVSQLRFGDTGLVSEEGYHTLGNLECYGMG